MTSSYAIGCLYTIKAAKTAQLRAFLWNLPESVKHQSKIFEKKSIFFLAEYVSSIG